MSTHNSTKPLKVEHKIKLWNDLSEQAIRYGEYRGRDLEFLVEESLSKAISADKEFQKWAAAALAETQKGGA
jgi:hypothetical protein